MEFRLKSEKASSFEDFVTLLKSLLEITMPGVTFFSAFSYGNEPRLDQNPIITYQVIDRLVGDKELKPKHRETILTDTNEAITIYGQKFDYVVEFNIWGESNEQVEKSLDTFEDVINTYTGDLVRSGVQRIQFLEQLQDKEHPWKDKLLCRPLRYLIRIERHTVIKEPLLKTITVRTDEGLILKISNEEE
jgi:hypothetical protein